MSSMSMYWHKLILARRLGHIVLTLVIASWCWKILEIAGREGGALQRNLGWGYFVSLDIPVFLTIGAGLLFVARKAARRLR